MKGKRKTTGRARELVDILRSQEKGVDLESKAGPQGFDLWLWPATTYFGVGSWWHEKREEAVCKTPAELQEESALWRELWGGDSLRENELAIFRGP